MLLDISPSSVLRHVPRSIFSWQSSYWSHDQTYRPIIPQNTETAAEAVLMAHTSWSWNKMWCSAVESINVFCYKQGQWFGRCRGMRNVHAKKEFDCYSVILTVTMLTHLPSLMWKLRASKILEAGTCCLAFILFREFDSHRRHYRLSLWSPISDSFTKNKLRYFAPIQPICNLA